MRTLLLSSLLPLVLAAGCGDNIRPDDYADLRQANPTQLDSAVAAASGRDAASAAELVSALAAGDAACPGIDTQADGAVVLTGCGDVVGRAVIEHLLGPSRDGRVRITLDGFGDATRSYDGVIEQDPDGSVPLAELDAVGGVAVTTHLSVACDGVGLCVPTDSWIDVDGLGRADVIGAWRNQPAGGYLTLVGEQTLTLDLNAGGACTPYTIDGEAAGCL